MINRTMNSAHTEIKSALVDIEQEMRVLDLWESISPSPEALSSTEPFAIDAMEFTQWIQFIFLPKIHCMLEEKSLPDSCAIAPMAEEYFTQAKVVAPALVQHIRTVDRLITQS